jgi:vitamin K-dependent gamma-carboxylase
VEIEAGRNQTLLAGDRLHIPVNTSHRVHTVSDTPSCYMYVYANETLREPEIPKDAEKDNFIHYMRQRWSNIKQAVSLVGNALLKIVFSVPMVKRVRMS